MLCRVINGVWLAASGPAAVRFAQAAGRVRLTQERLLGRLLSRNADTQFGHQHRFASISNVDEYQERVPIRSYDEYRSWLEHAAAGHPNVLTRERIRLFEPTGGSSGGRKLIPYTASLQREFQRGIQPWIVDLFRSQPDVMAGPAYWSISPCSTGLQQTAGGIPIGFDDDVSYVGGWLQHLTRALLAVPRDIRHLCEIEVFRYRTLLALLKQPNLRLISVWHPTFLSLLVQRFDEWGDALERDLGADVAARRRVRRARRAGTEAERHRILWPRLALISCWADGQAAGAAADLRALFPHVELQGKGLIATEGFISFPLAGRTGSVLAIRSHFLEFAAVGETGDLVEERTSLAHELEQGRRYAVILSNGGGLYRYRLDDVIEVAGYYDECPLVRFVGRRGCIADRFGEKLHEAHAAHVTRDALHELGVSAAFSLLACDTTLQPPAYVLYIDSTSPDEALRRVADCIDIGLRRNFQYDYARRLGQLAPVRVFRASGASRSYFDAAVRRGQRPGDIKPLALDRGDDWSRRFHGQFV